MLFIDQTSRCVSQLKEGEKVLEVINNLDFEMLLRLIIAATLGLAIGLERELKRKSLGLKTILVISTISCLLTIVSIQASYVFPASEFLEIRMDPLRLAAQIVSGVGFLGAGVILQRGDDTISGLTTAAMVWGAAGIGIAVGAGFYIEAITGVALLLVSVELIPIIINKVNVQSLHLKELYLRVTVQDREDISGVVTSIKKYVVRVENIRIKDVNKDSHLLVLMIIVNDRLETADIYNEIAKIEAVETIEIRA